MFSKPKYPAKTKRVFIHTSMYYGDSLCFFPYYVQYYVHNTYLCTYYVLNISFVGECFMQDAMQFGKMKKKEATILIVHIL